VPSALATAGRKAPAGAPMPTIGSFNTMWLSRCLSLASKAFPYQPTIEMRVAEAAGSGRKLFFPLRNSITSITMRSVISWWMRRMNAWRVMPSLGDGLDDQG